MKIARSSTVHVPVRWPPASVSIFVVMLGVGTSGLRAEIPLVRSIVHEGFSEVVDHGAGKRLVEKLHSTQAGVLGKIDSWRGAAEIDEWFRVNDLGLNSSKDVKEPLAATPSSTKRGSGPFLVHRKSLSEFVWSESLRSLRATFHAAPGTTAEAMSDKSEYRFDESLSVNGLVRPDGYYTFRPLIEYGNFEQYPQSLPAGKTTKAAERLQLERARAESEFSSLFNPSSLFVIGGQRVDDLSASYLDARVWGRGDISVKQSKSGAVVVTTKYRGSENAASSSALHVEVLLEPADDYLPKQVVFQSAGKTSQSIEWVYRKEGDVVVPARVVHVKCDSEGKAAQARAISITESHVNAPVSSADFSLASIGIADGHRIVDRIEGRLLVVKNGEPSAVDEVHARPGRASWVIFINALAGAVLVVVFATRLLRRYTPSP